MQISKAIINIVFLLVLVDGVSACEIRLGNIDVVESTSFDTGDDDLSEEESSQNTTSDDQIKTNLEAQKKIWKKILFELFTPERGSDFGFEFGPDVNPNKLIEQNFKPKRMTKVIINGYEPGNSIYAYFVKMYFELHKNFNIIILHWSKINGYPFGHKAPRRAKIAGDLFGEAACNIFVKGLNVDPANIHVMGYSLGAHVAGYFGRTFSEFCGKKIGRITGLDPSNRYTLFSLSGDKVGLNRGDATFIDVIHCQDGNALLGGVGMFEAIGDADFYPNGGILQAGCDEICIFNHCFKSPLIDKMKYACSHRRTLLYFLESIVYNPPIFVSHHCQSWEEFQKGMCKDAITLNMGDQITKSENFETYISKRAELNHSRFFLRTHSSMPFSYYSDPWT